MMFKKIVVIGSILACILNLLDLLTIYDRLGQSNIFNNFALRGFVNLLDSIFIHYMARSMY
jgi:hypothetical protein